MLLRMRHPCFRVVLKITGIGGFLGNLECGYRVTGDTTFAPGGDTVDTYVAALNAC